MSISVGINYPWINYGWDFGPPPPSWVASSRVQNWRAQKRARIVSDLRYFKCLGFFAVRWFLLGDGTNYGLGRNAPQLNRRTGRWNFTPLPRGHSFYPQLWNDFEFVLRTLAGLGMKLVPVLLDYKWCLPARSASNAREVIKGGRVGIFEDWTKRAAFFDNTLQPLLAISRRYQDTIFAWELINEPKWIVPRPVAWDLMADFIRDGARRINSSGFRSTVGFYSWDTLNNREAQTLGLTLPQFHYYPHDDALPRPRQLSRQPVFIGEFASAVHRPWPELQQLSSSQSIANRLRLAETKGYSAAFIWSGTPGLDRTTQWTLATEADVLSYTRLVPPPVQRPYNQNRRIAPRRCWRTASAFGN